MRGKSVEPVFAPLTRRIASECFGKPQMRQTDSTARAWMNASAPNCQRLVTESAAGKNLQAYEELRRESSSPTSGAMRKVS
jgi:hypothetical protein